jgi:structural maintenance of chromosome 3 (chondroitin sulfate proteoglycan 6)
LLTIHYADILTFQEERQALLHEGSGSAALQAFVEIVFDNSDHRFQHETNDEVVLRRTISLKKDEFFLNRKKTNKADVQSLLEGAGFSKSNPYFIVQQGKIQDLCTMSDAARLKLLKEVAGTTVYDEKKAESMTKMEENKASIENIAEMLSNIEERLEELNAEKDELTAYQQLDRERRAAQYALYNLELQKARTQLEQNDQERKEQTEATQAAHEAMKANHDAIRKTEDVVKNKESHLRRVRQTIAGLEDDKKQAVTLETKLNVECKELEEALAAGDELAALNKTKLAEIEREIVAAETELNDHVGPSHSAAATALQDMITQRSNAVKQTDALYAKQGRGRLYRTAAERDTFLAESSAQLESARTEKAQELSQLHETLADLRRKVVEEASDIAKLQHKISEKSAAQQSLSKSIDEITRKRVEQNDARRENWRQKEELQEQVREAREALHGCLFDTKKVMPRATAAGLEALRKIVDQEKLTHGKEYFGMLMENMTLKDPKFQAAVEAAAQNSLFHVIVDTDHTAARLMKRLEDGKLGRVTFLPINQLRLDPVTYPDSSNKDVRPLLDMCIAYDKVVDRVMKHVFARKLIARSKESASEWSIKLGMDAITLDGDLFGRKGALTGGFVDSSRSRLRAYGRQIEAQDTLSSVERKYEDCKAISQTVEQGIQSLVQETQRLEAKHAELSREIVTMESTLEQLELRHENHKKQIESVESETVPRLDRSISDLDGDIKRLKDEMDTELQQTLTTEDRERLVALKKLQETLASKIEAQQDVVQSTSLAKQKLQSLLEDNLYLQRRALNDEAVAARGEGSNRRLSRGRLSTAEVRAQQDEDLALRKSEMESAARVVEDIESRLKEARSVEANLRKEYHAAKNEWEKLRGKDMQNDKAFEDAKEKSDRLLGKVSHTTSSVLECLSQL